MRPAKCVQCRAVRPLDDSGCCAPCAATWDRVLAEDIAQARTRELTDEEYATALKAIASKLGTGIGHKD